MATISVSNRRMAVPLEEAPASQATH
jgi:hypothetical protein